VCVTLQRARRSVPHRRHLPAVSGTSIDRELSSRLVPAVSHVPVDRKQGLRLVPAVSHEFPAGVVRAWAVCVVGYIPSPYA